MRPVTGHKAMVELTTTVTSRAGHASDPRGAANAIATAARMIALIGEEAAAAAENPRDTPFDPPWTTFGIGRIEGGEARNVIPDRCRFDWEIRPLPEEDGPAIAGRIDRRVQAEIAAPLRERDPATAIRTEIVASPIGLPPNPGGPAATLVRTLWTDAAPGVVAFGTDAGYPRAAGIDTVVFGPGDIARAHRPEEYIREDELAEALAFLGRLGEHLAA